MSEKRENTSGTHSLFVYRGFMQNSQQATVEKPVKQRPLIIPRTGTSAPTGAPTMKRQPFRKGK